MRRPLRQPNRLTTLGLLLLGAVASTSLTSPDLSAQQGVTAFQNVNVIPMDEERVLGDQTVVVREGRIAEIGPAADVEAPADALVVDGSGKYLLPGLAEMHAHIPNAQGETDAVDRTLFLYLAGGVTTIRGSCRTCEYIVIGASLPTP